MKTVLGTVPSRDGEAEARSADLDVLPATDSFGLKRSEHARAAGDQLPAAAVAAAPRALVRSRPATVGFSDALVSRLDSIIAAAIADRATPGATIAVARRGQLVMLKGYGRTDWAPGAPAVTPARSQ